MVFSGDGRAMLCERCGHQQELEVQKQSTIEQLIKLRRMVAANRIENRSMRSMLRLGVGSFNDGHLPVARSYFEQVILNTGMHDEEMEAWVWLARLITDPAEMRGCLEQALAIDPTNGEARKELAILDGRIAPDLLDGAARPTPSADPLESDVQQMMCPNCTGAMTFDPERQQMVCPFCHHAQSAVVSIDVTRDEQFGQGALEQDFDAAVHSIQGEAKPEQMRLLTCQGCGTEFVLGPETLSLTCAYCSSVYVTEAAETAELIPPQAVIPLALNRDHAQQAAIRWFKERRISRSDLTRVSPLSGLYIPVWTFDIGGEIKWQGVMTRGEQRSGRSTRVNVTNSKYVFYNDVLVLAMIHQNQLFQELIQGYDLEQITPYDPRLLADWPAERYTVSVSDAARQARTAVTKKVRQMPHGLEGGGDLDAKSIRTNMNGLVIESYKLLLLPVWTLHYHRQDKPYDMLINGQTGEVEGVDERGMVAKLKAWFTN